MIVASFLVMNIVTMVYVHEAVRYYEFRMVVRTEEYESKKNTYFVML